MAQCRNCKANFGCGCQLVNGLCATCRNNERIENEKIKQQNVSNQPKVNKQ